MKLFYIAMCAFNLVFIAGSLHAVFLRAISRLHQVEFTERVNGVRRRDLPPLVTKAFDSGEGQPLAARYYSADRMSTSLQMTALVIIGTWAAQTEDFRPLLALSATQLALSCIDWLSARIITAA